MNRNFKIIKIDHIAIATKNINKTQNIFSNLLGMKFFNQEKVENEKVNVLKLFINENDTSIELIEPIYEDSTVKKFLDKKGESIHHIAFEVDSIINATEYLQYNNVQVIYAAPQKGSDNKLINFIHPKFSPGILIELCQKF